jgi:hypothetical protein
MYILEEGIAFRWTYHSTYALAEQKYEQRRGKEKWLDKSDSKSFKFAQSPITFELS